LPVLYELRVENLLLMERAELRLGAGLNVLTGETGAGKTLLAHALDLLLGGRARSGLVRQAAAEAYVEGVFELPAGLDDERVPEGAEELVLARRVWPDGRTRAYVCGRSATVADLRELGGRLIAFYGQHEHRKLMLAAAQLDALDGFCGPAQLELRGRAAAAHERVRELEARVSELEALAGARERELDLVAFELQEIEAVAPSQEEESELIAERDRLRHFSILRSAAATGAEAVAPEEGDGAGARLAAASAALEQASPFDAALTPLAERMNALRYEAEDLAGELRAYLAGLDESDGTRRSLDEVEERLGLFARLARKHGGSIDEVLAHAERCRARQVELQGSEEALETSAEELRAAVAERAVVGSELRAAREQAAPRLAEAVRERLGDLAMTDARFEVALRDREDGFGPRGQDAVEFMIATAPGLPLGPLREVASGGELSRVMLALLGVAHSNSPSAEAREAEGGADAGGELIVFDEIDAGIGGRTARAVGEQLRSLAEGRQILCITHLPQVAAMAARHFTIVKDTSVTPPRTTVTSLEGDGVVGELVRMLGAPEDDRAARGHARELLRAA
jgi:DNA repair protein RecN (Recombination protein N)